MATLGIDLIYSKKIIYWDGEALPMKASGMLTDSDVCEAIYFAHTNAPLLQDIAARHNKILDADYSKVNIDAMVDDMANLSKFNKKC